MFEFDMHEAAFLSAAAHELEDREGDWLPTPELYAELRLLSVAESEAARRD